MGKYMHMINHVNLIYAFSWQRERERESRCKVQIFVYTSWLAGVTGKRGNVEINNSPQVGIEPGASIFKIQHSTEWALEIPY